MLDYESVRVVSKPKAAEIVNLSLDTFERLLERGEGPTITRLSDRRIGFRIADINDWLSARRVRA